VVELTDPDAEIFLARLTRLDQRALVRFRPAGAGPVMVFAMLPWGTLVCREVTAEITEDVTVRAQDALQHRFAPRRDLDWRWQLPPVTSTTVETLPAALVRRLADAAAATLRQASGSGVDGRPVGARALRDALLDHVAVYVTSTVDGKVVEVPQRLIQAVVRMGFLPVDGVGEVAVRSVGSWVGLVTVFGAAWYRPVAPSLTPLSSLK
jgi:hypothetical protein